MKKIVLAFFVALIITIPQAVMAANGDIAGNIYSTDIKANINGVWVDSYCIDGKTVVVIEDITSNYRYYDDIRTLTCDRFDKDDLKPGKNTTAQTPGKIIGKIYETDIKTFIGGQHVPCYALDGKMAVAIEDLGNDGEFSDIGGKYMWNADERTITLELAYNNLPFDILKEKHLKLEIDYDTLTADFVSEPIIYGGMSGYRNTELDKRADITYKGEVICRTFKCEKIGVYNNNGVHTLADDGVERIYYYDIDKIKELTSDIEPAQLTYQDWLDYFEHNTPCREKERLETDDYIFIYMHFSNRHGGTEGLIKLDKHDGTRIDFDENFESVSLWGQKYFEDVLIDRENEKVYFHYDVDYVIDLKTEKIKTIELDAVTLTDFIGIESDEIEKVTMYSPSTGTECETGIEGFLDITDCIAVVKNDTPEAIDSSGLYITVYKTDGDVKNIYISVDGGVDECKAHSETVPHSKYIIKNAKRIEKLYEAVRPRTYATTHNEDNS